VGSGLSNGIGHKPPVTDDRFWPDSPPHLYVGCSFTPGVLGSSRLAIQDLIEVLRRGVDKIVTVNNPPIMPVSSGSESY